MSGDLGIWGSFIILLKICSLKEFNKYKLIVPKNIDEINNLADYVSLKIDSLSV